MGSKDFFSMGSKLCGGVSSVQYNFCGWFKFSFDICNTRNIIHPIYFESERK